ncbi:DUF2798 domain-containing protein [Sphingomonas koreensis]
MRGCWWIATADSTASAGRRRGSRCTCSSAMRRWDCCGRVEVCCESVASVRKAARLHSEGRKRLTSGNASNPVIGRETGSSRDAGRCPECENIMPSKFRPRRLPARHAGLVSAFILSIMMTFVVSAIATARSLGFSEAFPRAWMGAWALSWVIAFPVLLMVLPVVRRIVGAIVERPSA